ncbi:hypothetical protein [Bacillus sp. BP-3]|uniref:hypothetical protein n=1 Tax=Bacillus sp. BP-3 TaxID=3022773 RepID=UPI00232F735B|nr:hypothetical protein [Bacillus sp. BP-3]MDC2864217.1 hypothetical protein [Bacillus sp. BP-3]
MFFFKNIKKLKKEHYVLKEMYHETKDREHSLMKELERLAEIEADGKFIESMLKQGYIIDGIEINKTNMKYYVCVTMDSGSITISLRNKNLSHSYPRLYVNFVKDLYNPYIITCYIVDVFAVEENIGNGSILMKYIIKWAKKMKACELNGMLSNVDIEKLDKLEKFYENNGFTVKFNEARTSGGIELKL